MSVNIFGKRKLGRDIDIQMKRLCHVATAKDANDVISLGLLDSKIRDVLNQRFWLKSRNDKSISDKLPNKIPEKLQTKPLVKKFELTKAEKLAKKSALLRELKVLMKSKESAVVKAKKKVIQEDIKKLNV